MNWNLAHRIAGIAANQAHRDLGVDRTGYVPVHRSLTAARVIGMAQPMPRLFGVYRSERDDGPAILLNSGLDIITQRHTAAHELGHHRLGHHSVYDKEIDPGLRWGNGSWPEQEKTAEAFAAWYLMPRPAVLAVLQRIAQGRPRGPEDAYSVARALGTSYAGTVRHLVRLSQLEAGRAEQWLRVPPAAIKSSLLQGRPVAAGVHVHALAAAWHGQRVHADVGDILVLHMDLGRSFFDALPKGIEPWSDGTYGGGQLEAVTITDEFICPGPVRIEVSGCEEPLQVTVVRESPRTGVDEAWPP